MQNNGYLKLKNYFENITNQANFLKGFAGFFSRELANKLTSRKEPLQAPYLALFKYQLGLDGDKMKTIGLRKIGFAIIFNNIKPDDYEAQYAAIDEAETLALKVLARVRYDSNIKDHFLTNSLQKDSFNLEPVELTRSDFGVEVTFDLKNSQSLKLDPEDWKDITTIC